MASNVMITDVLDELNEENSRLINELVFSKQLIELFDNYRHLVKSLQTNCCCIENNELKTHLNQLEDNYLRLKTTKQKNVDKNLTKNLRPKKILKITESTDNLLIRDYIKTRNKLNNSYEKTANKSLSDREVLMKNKNKTWINKIDFTKQPKSLATNTKHLNSSSSSAVCIKQYNNNNNHNTSDDKKPIVIDNNNNNDNHNPD
ncbi:putative uncharacterized protein DDB_G0282133, partial [Oppia nitens]|uniref:putative uncharacterized protein DDB_G0282133 n=1 Tax=Oppia nitens TaxID=1686743 RepID=UPI0023D9DBEC